MTDNLLNKTENILEGKNNGSYCEETIRINKIVLNDIMQRPNDNIQRINSRFARSENLCAEEQRNWAQGVGRGCFQGRKVEGGCRDCEDLGLVTIPAKGNRDKVLLKFYSACYFCSFLFR